MAKPLSQLSVDFEKLPNEIRLNGLRSVARKIGKFIAEDMAARAPKDEGALAKDIMYSIERAATIDQIVVKVGPSTKTAWRANFIEYGVRPHTIKTKASRALVNMKTGEVFGRSVKHPGHRAQPFIRPAGDENHEEVSRMFFDELNKLIVQAFK